MRTMVQSTIVQDQIFVFFDFQLYSRYIYVHLHLLTQSLYGVVFDRSYSTATTPHLSELHLVAELSMTTRNPVTMLRAMQFFCYLVFRMLQRPIEYETGQSDILQRIILPYNQVDLACQMMYLRFVP